MICIDGSKLSVEGTGAELITELTVVIKSMYDKGLLTDERMSTVLKLAKMTSEEIHEESESCVREFLNRVLDDDSEHGKDMRLKLLLRLFAER